MTDLERFFEHLVRSVVASDPSMLTRPITLMAIREEIMPYRTSRRALGLDTADEYEELLMRLVGEENDLVKTEPPEVAEWCQRQMSSLTPDLSGIPGQTNAELSVRPDALVGIVGEDALSQLAKAGPDGPAPGAIAMVPERCPHCDSTLPTNRAVSFCQACGRSVTVIPCDHCGADMETGWRFCVACGQEVTDRGSG